MKYAITLLTLLSSSQAIALTDLEKAAVYAVDRSTCRLYVSQAWVDGALMRASLEYNMTAREVVRVAAEVGTALERDLRESGKVQEYCEARRVK